MHIAMYSPAWPLERFQNGIVTYCHWMKQGLESQGHRVSIICAQTATAAPVEGVYLAKATRWDRLRRRWARNAGGPQQDAYTFSQTIARTILRIHRSDPIDLIEMEESFGWFEDVRRLTNIPLVVKLHGPAFLSLVGEEIDSAEGRYKIDQEGHALRKASTILAPCSSTLRDTIERYKLSPKLVAHVVNPLTLDDKTPLWRLSHCEQGTLLFVGRFDSRKGGDIVLRAFLSVLRKRPHLRLVFVGPDRGLRAEDGRKESFDEFISSVFPAELRSRVDYRGPMANRDILNLRARSLLTIVASRWENPGYTLLEAMFQGCPVLCSDAAGCRETVQDGITGRVARSEDVEDFATKILEIVGNPQCAAELGSAARALLLDMYSTKRVAVQSLDIYRRVLGY